MVSAQPSSPGRPSRTREGISGSRFSHGYVSADHNGLTPSERVQRRLVDVSQCHRCPTIGALMCLLRQMGFSEGAYPHLPDMIRSHLATNESPTQDDEEEIVAQLVEEILSYSPPPAPSGSGPRLHDE
jgi:hypothetical protein